jgi:hypothetical protein
MAMSKSIGRLAIALLVVLAASSVFAQNAGSLRGNVTDQQGAVLPGATVVLRAGEAFAGLGDRDMVALSARIAETLPVADRSGDVPTARAVPTGGAIR